MLCLTKISKNENDCTELMKATQSRRKRRRVNILIYVGKKTILRSKTQLENIIIKGLNEYFKKVNKKMRKGRGKRKINGKLKS